MGLTPVRHDEVVVTRQRRFDQRLCCPVTLTVVLRNLIGNVDGFARQYQKAGDILRLVCGDTFNTCNPLPYRLPRCRAPRRANAPRDFSAADVLSV